MCVPVFYSPFFFVFPWNKRCTSPFFFRVFVSLRANWRAGLGLGGVGGEMRGGVGGGLRVGGERFEDSVALVVEDQAERGEEQLAGGDPEAEEDGEEGQEGGQDGGVGELVADGGGKGYLHGHHEGDFADAQAAGGP